MPPTGNGPPRSSTAAASWPAGGAAPPEERGMGPGVRRKAPPRGHFARPRGRELGDPATTLGRGVPRVSSAGPFARLVAMRAGIYQLSGVASDEHADATVERF